MKTKTRYGHFGNLSANYAQARQGFPAEVFDLLWSKLNMPRPKILDVGCGTGISTRQLTQRGANVIGVDRDQDMLKRAKENQEPSINYISAAVTDLPFEDESFDAVCAFSAFHWFANNKALGEIYRVLKPQGAFFIVNKVDDGDFKTGYRMVMAPFIEGHMPDPTQKYQWSDLLAKNHFGDIETKYFPAIEKFTFENAIAYLQSISLWNLVSDSRKTEALKAMTDFCLSKRDSEGFINRALQIQAVLATK
ncbi:MAG: hypothetical protein A3A80_04225 [Candidatus Terrybacteria bacterium RIFCSPLOWO2_01_FULL_44_24]|uniref:Methyltransferase type 11 domain-containing protein n=1 Tax=Candidatus Terrybacteria bacterium RIFCSPHIGHO2_01_FULL_43_35 TaxID=1802361 RepID=A0A1G2PDP0_9BACT|nr:MAG: hypothetical protein A2828_01100 [Candidatus Terrybacteria bacterium RIFCSPHIGHO2_01_FULL_43_35]OHA51842.1 MAG: hypothetical protein A3A80_04225 [Candidatus Terrybacteria bacterium RIFCSPLOWO2_01_FULL_44_24]